MSLIARIRIPQRIFHPLAVIERKNPGRHSARGRCCIRSPASKIIGFYVRTRRNTFYLLWRLLTRHKGPYVLSSSLRIKCYGNVSKRHGCIIGQGRARSQLSSVVYNFFPKTVLI